MRVRDFVIFLRIFNLLRCVEHGQSSSSLSFKSTDNITIISSISA